MRVLDAAAKVLAEAKEPLNFPILVRTMLQRYRTTKRQTAAAALHAAIHRIKNKQQTRFKKVGRAKFTLKG